MNDIYSMTSEDFRREGQKDGARLTGDIAGAFDKIASECNIMAYFGMGIFKQDAYVQGFKEGFFGGTNE